MADGFTSFAPSGWLAWRRRSGVAGQGTNVLVFQVVSDGWDWLGCVRLVDAAGRPVQGIRFTLTPEP